MLPFRKIVFPVDYSASCKAIVPYVKDMLHHFPAELTLVHAAGLGLEQLVSGELTTADPDWEEKSRAIEKKKLQEFGAEMFPGVHVEALAEEGDPGTAIHRVIQHQGADLVMLPTHGFGPVRRFLLGSVAAKVLHDVTTVVWTSVHSAWADHTPGIPYKSMVCALDNNQDAEAILRTAVAFAAHYSAQLHLVHVCEIPSSSWKIDFAYYQNDIERAADHWLGELKRSLGVDAKHEVIIAPVADGIRQVTVQQKADLLIVGRGLFQGTFSRAFSSFIPSCVSLLVRC